jgi:serine/threonine protein kinase/Flp pilus assembly protein TadD
LPRAGDTFAGFRLVRELGRGSFGRVYLATQSELGERTVALKLSADLTGESRALAQLQHTNIMPVYSVHRDGVFQAVCMPYFGSHTLADLITKCRAKHTLPVTGRDLVNTLRDLTSVTRPEASPADSFRGLKLSDSAPAPSGERVDAVFSRLARMTYTEAVCWLVARVADGLAHAHDRGILHRDVKPANVLLTDDGQPMLLDFGVAEDLKVRAAAGGPVGGTIPYMAPEHLDEIRSDLRSADHRSDLYSLGVILFELLTGRHPFRTPAGDVREELPALVAERSAWVPDVRAANPDVAADLEAIVRKCVAVKPADRYQSAEDLRDDLDRHLHSEPLKVAAEPSVWVRVQKWRRRNPRLPGQVAVGLAVVAAAALSVGTVIAGKRLEDEKREQARLAAQREQEIARHQADKQFDEFQDELRYGRYLLTGGGLGESVQADGMARVRHALDRYAVTDDADWQSRTGFAALPDDQKRVARQALSDACMLLARGHLRRAPADPARLTAAGRFNTLAETVRDGPPPHALLAQRAELYRLMKLTDDADRFQRTADDTPLVTAEDHYLSANELLTGGRSAAAIPLFQKALRLDPTHFWARFGLGVAYTNTGRYADARNCFSTTIALRPEFVWSYFNRGLAEFTLGLHDEATDDLNTVLDEQPNDPLVRYHRALARGGAGDREAALKDLAAVLAVAKPDLQARAYLSRARLLRDAGDADGARADYEAGLKYTPTDETGWLTRSYAQIETDPTAALADLEHALKLNPDSIPGLRNRLYLLDKLGRNEECLATVDRLIRMLPAEPIYPPGRAVLLARLGRYPDALAAAAKIPVTGATPMIRYQIGCVYALASRSDPKLRAVAVRHVAAALDAGFPVAEVVKDPDVEAIRTDPAFVRLIADAKGQ